ncbi:MAG: serine hydrolase [Methylovirgula sp.]
MRRSDSRRSDFGSSFVKLFSLIHVISGGSRGALRIGFLLIATGASSLGFVAGAAANPAIVVDAASGDVLYAEQASEPWYPASLTKLMTFYLALSAVRDHKISLDTPIVISARAARAAPSKMGFKPGTEVTLGNALKMLVVKSANDIAIAIAEGVDGSVEAFAEDMNATAAQLGMRQTHFVNPNGLPDPEHMSSARDLAVLGRAIYVTFPQASEMFGIGALRLGDEIIPTHNTLLGRYPGVDGMKTGFTCASGFNLIASAQRNGHRYIAVVLGAPNVPLRMLKTAVLLDRAFDGVDHPQGKLDVLDGASPGAAPDMHSEICRRRAKAVAAYQAQITQLEAPLLTQTPPAAPPLGLGFFAGAATQMTPIAPTIAMLPKPVFDPVPVYVGPAPGYQGPVAQARPPHSPVGTAPPPEAASADDAAKPQAPSKTPPPPKAHHHLAHKQAAKVTAKAKTGHRVAKVETEKKETTVSGSPKKDAAAKRHALKKSHAAKPTKTAAFKKHLAKHAAATQSPQGSGKAKPIKVAAPAGQ